MSRCHTDRIDVTRSEMSRRAESGYRSPTGDAVPALLERHRDTQSLLHRARSSLMGAGSPFRTVH